MVELEKKKLYYPNIEILEGFLPDTFDRDKMLIYKIEVRTLVRKKYKGLWYAIKVSDQIEFSVDKSKSMIDILHRINKHKTQFINKVLTEAFKAKKWFDIKEALKYTSGIVEKDYLQLSEKVRAADYSQKIQIL